MAEVRGVRIERVEAVLASYPWSGYFKFLAGAHGHRVVFVTITADNGVVGWGQSLPAPRWSYEVPEASLAFSSLFGAFASSCQMVTCGARSATTAPAWSIWRTSPIAWANRDCVLTEPARPFPRTSQRTSG